MEAGAVGRMGHGDKVKLFSVDAAADTDSTSSCVSLALLFSY